MMDHIAFYLKDVYFSKKSGRLVFGDKGIQKYLFFQEGFLIFVKTNNPQKLIGEVLFELGKISNETYSAIDQFIEPMHSIGELLIKDGRITRNDLDMGLMYQMRENILDIFLVFDGKFKFQEKKGSYKEEFKLKVDIPDLIEEGIRRLDYKNTNFKKFLENKVPFPKGNELLDRLTEEERKILKKIDGDSSIETLLEPSDFRPELYWKSLFLFYCLDLIDIKDREKIPLKKKKADKAEKRISVSEEKKKKVEEKPSKKKGKTKKPVHDELKERVDEVETMSEKLSTMDYYQVLDVPQTASQDEIKRAYFRLARKYHPDSFDRDLSSEAKDKIEGIFDVISKAYQTLISDEMRKEYDSKMDSPPEDDKRTLAKRADIKFRQGKTLYNQGRYEEALVLLEEAVRLKEDKGSYFLLLAMTESKLPAFAKKAEEDFLEAQRLEPWNSECYLGLGMFYKKEGLLAKARSQFRKAVEVDPENKAALKELNLAEKSKKKSKLKGVFSFDPFSKKKR